MRYKVDYDYIDRLSDAEKAWLEKATNEIVGGTGGGYPAKNAANRDALTHPDGCALLGAIAADEAASRGDWAPTPEYLDTPEYKAALAGFRRYIHDNWRIKPHPTMQMAKAQARLERTKRGSKK